ncbi:hypothetical protein T492DRAFT_859023 [Pavlovales sp. CCMP2436]|nr:hypothetical protein T492DRAFT_859023 [Pavlovales sp. CCMP2436]
MFAGELHFETSKNMYAAELAAALEQLAASHHQRAEQLEHPETPQMDLDEDPGYEFLRVVRHEKKEWHPGFEISPARKRETAMQGRSVQQSKFFVTLVLHRRATWDEAHNAHVMQQMAGAQKGGSRQLELAVARQARQADDDSKYGPSELEAEDVGVPHVVGLVLDEVVMDEA